jgi:hypothetical protein
MQKNSYEKGEYFACLVARMINCLLDLKGNRRVKPTPQSGAIVGWKGDLTNLPECLKDYVIECKNHKKINIPMWWRQVVDEGIKMAKEPMLVISLEDEILIVKRLKEELK